MKNHFDFKRISLLFRKEWEEKRWYYLATLLVYYSCTTIVCTWNSLNCIPDYPTVESVVTERIQDTCIIIIALLGILVAASRGTAFFSENNKRGNTTFLSLPASMEEKFFVKWCYVVPLTGVAFLLCVILADYTRIFICSLIYPESDFFRPLIRKLPNEMGLLYVRLWLAIQALFMLGSTVWKKNAFIKTSALSMTLLTVYVITSSNIMQNLISDAYYIIWPEEFINLWTVWFLWLFIVGMWILTYYRVKQTDIAYGRVRTTSYIIIGLTVLGLLISIILPYYVSSHFRTPPKRINLAHYKETTAVHELPDFRHLVLKDLTASQLSPTTADTTLRSLNYSSSEITLRIDTVSGNTLHIPERIWTYLTINGHGDTLEIGLNYPIRNYINSFEDKYKLDSLSVYIGNWTINVQALQSVTCEIPVRNLRLTGFHQDKLTVGYHHAEMDSCQIEKLHLKSIAMPANALINGKKEPSRIISFKNSHIGQLYRYKEKYVDYEILDNAKVDSNFILTGL